MTMVVEAVTHPAPVVRQRGGPRRHRHWIVAAIGAITTTTVVGGLALMVLALRPQPLSTTQVTQPVTIGDPLNRFPSRVGVLHSVFRGESSDEVHFFCTASVVSRGDQEPTGPTGPTVILSAAHCVAPTPDDSRLSVRSVTFYPGRHIGENGSVVDPYGGWDVSAFVSGWGPPASLDPSRPAERDIAFGVLCPRDGDTLEAAVGSLPIGLAQHVPSMVTATGYPRRTVDDEMSNDGEHPWLLQAVPSRTGSILLGFDGGLRLPGDPAVIAGGMSGAPVMSQSGGSPSSTIGWVITSKRTSSPFGSRLSPSLIARPIDDRAWSDYLTARSLETDTGTEWTVPGAECS